MYVQHYNNTRGPKKLSRHKGRHHFQVSFFPYTSQNQKRNTFLHKILSLLTEQDEFDIGLANPGFHAGFSSKRTKSAPLFFLYAFFQSSFACIYCHRRKNVLNMGEGARLRILGAKG